MEITKTNLPGCIVIEPSVFKDERGYFLESYNAELFNKAVGQNVNFVQDNESFSTKGVLRGLHFQKGAFSQAKLVRVTHGKVLDIAVDIRKDSDTFGEHFSIELSAKNKKQLFVPRGFAHGFVVLSKTARFFYKCDNYYNKASEGGIAYNDPDLAIDWKLSKDKLVLSEKDLVLPVLSKYKF